MAMIYTTALFYNIFPAFIYYLYVPHLHVFSVCNVAPFWKHLQNNLIKLLTYIFICSKTNGKFGFI